jgi:hypothetical protein
VVVLLLGLPLSRVCRELMLHGVGRRERAVQLVLGRHEVVWDAAQVPGRPPGATATLQAIRLLADLMRDRFLVLLRELVLQSETQKL